MRSSRRSFEVSVDRRAALGLLGAGGALLAWPALAADPAVLAALRAGGVVAAFRHALAPGTFDPPEFKLGDCSTQRNLNDEGRAQARRLGEWFRAQGMKPAAVRSSPWCRCVDTARLAFGDSEVQAWPALGSPRHSQLSEGEQVAALRRALAAVPAGRFEVWVSHQFTLSALVGQSTGSGEGLLLRAASDGGTPQLIGRLPPT